MPTKQFFTTCKRCGKQILISEIRGVSHHIQTLEVTSADFCQIGTSCGGEDVVTTHVIFLGFGINAYSILIHRTVSDVDSTFQVLCKRHDNLLSVRFRGGILNGLRVKCS